MKPQQDKFGAILVQPEVVAQKAEETAKNSWAGSVMEGFGFGGKFDPAKFALSVLGAVGVVFGVSGLMNKFIKSGGIFKMGSKIDGFVDKLMKNRTIKNVSDSASKTFGDLKKKFAKTDLGKLFSDKSNLIQPKNDMAKLFMKGTYGEAVDEVTDALEFMVKENPSKLKNILTKAGCKDDVIKKMMTSISDIPKGDALEKFNVFNEISPHLKKYFSFDKNGKELIDFLSKGEVEKVTQKVRIPLFPLPIKAAHEVNLGEAIKKVMILDGYGAKTGLAKETQKILLRGAEAVSNGVTSRSKMALMMGLVIYAGVMNKSLNAPKGEKTATFAEEAVGDMGSYMLFPIAGSLLYGAASLKYWGMKSEQIQLYRSGLKDLSEKAAKGLVDKQGINNAYKTLQKSLYKDSKWYQKPFKKLASVLATGIEAKPGSIASKLKGFSGGALRFGIIMFGLSPFLIKPIIKACHAIFGKPTNSNYDYDKKKTNPTDADVMKQFQSMTPQQQYQYLAQLAATPEIAANPQQKQYVEELMKVLQAQMAQQQGTQPAAPVQAQPQQTLVQQQAAAAQPMAAQQPQAALPSTDPLNIPRSYVPSDMPAEHLRGKYVLN